MNFLPSVFCLLSIVLHSQFTLADETAGKARSLETRNALLLREHADIEEALVAQDSDRLTVFLSVQAAAGVVLEEAVLLLDGKAVARHRYTPAEQAKLLEGGVQPLYAGKLLYGEHSLRLELKVRQGKPLRMDPFTFAKKDPARFVELRIVGEPTRQVRVAAW